MKAPAAVRLHSGLCGTARDRMEADRFTQTCQGAVPTILSVLRKGPPTMRLRSYRELADVPRPSAVRAPALPLCPRRTRAPCRPEGRAQTAKTKAIERSLRFC